jgi:hypothetical protein
MPNSISLDEELFLLRLADDAVLFLVKDKKELGYFSRIGICYGQEGFDGDVSSEVMIVSIR